MVDYDARDELRSYLLDYNVLHIEEDNVDEFIKELVTQL